MAIAYIQPGEIWVRIVAGTRLRGESVAVGTVVAVTADEYVALAAANKAVKTDPPKPAPKPEPEPEKKPEVQIPAAKPAKAAKTENKK